MISFKLSALAANCGAVLKGSDLMINQVSSDSRKCADALFIALKGERFDGNDFAAAAADQGASALVLSRNCGIKNVPYIICKDTLNALRQSALLVRRQSKAKVLAITGSCGKTTVKTMTAAILKQLGPTLYTEGNYNNDIGVPQTILRLERAHQFAVIEQGASHPDDIARTCTCVQAHAALITNAGGAHIEGFGSEEGIYKGKSEILQDVFSRGGTGFVSADSKWTARWLKDFAKERAQGKLCLFGLDPASEVQAADIQERPYGLDFTLKVKDKSVRVNLPLAGAHNAVNAAAAASLALYAGASLEEVKSGLESLAPLPGRLQFIARQGFTLIDDTYNASFNAVRAALEVLSREQGFKIFIFGDMRELGAEAENLHRKVGAYAAGRADLLLAVGPLSANAVAAFGAPALHCAGAAEVLKAARDAIARHPGCTVLVKGSHAMRMHEIAAALAED